MIGDGQLGIFDASHADDPSVAARVWRSYSVVDVSPAYGWGAISTRISVSNDAGVTFQPLDGVVNIAADLDNGLGVNYEVPTLVRDPSAPEAERWKLVYVVAFYNTAVLGGYDPGLYWIGMRAAPNPAGPWGPETKLLAGAMFNPTVQPAPIHRDTTALMVTEPGCLPDQLGFWMSYQAMTGATTSEIRCVRFTANAATMAPCGSFVSANDLAMLRIFQPAIFADCAYLAAPFMFSRSGKTYLGVTPASANHAYRGTVVFQVQDTSRARLVKTMGIYPRVVRFIPPAQPHSGAGAYSGNSVGCGIVVSDFSPTQAPMFQLHATRVQVP